MKNNYLTLFLLFFVLSCTQQKEVKSVQSKSSIKTTVNLLLDDWHKAASEANFENYFGKMDSISVFIGTDATEIWNKKQFKAYSKPHFNKGKAWNFKAFERNIYVSDSKEFAWFDENLKTNRGTFRGSGVLEKKENNWKIKHYVLSVPIPNNDMNKVVKITRKNDSIFMSKFNN